jgi:hypothetical protein
MMNEPAGSKYSAQAQAFVQRHGVSATTILVGGAAAAIGTVIPFAHVNNFFGGGTSYSLIGAGIYGVVLFIIPIVLAVFPIALKQYARFSLVAYGSACGMFAIFFAVGLASSGVGSLVGSLGGLSLGFYLSLAGYAATVFGYYQLQKK